MKVALFIPCITDVLFAKTGMNMVRVLERLGVEVSYDPEQTCCGQPAFNSGYRREARTLAERFMKLFEQAEFVVAPSGSCTAMVGHHYRELLTPPLLNRWEEWRGRVYEFTSFLVDVLKVDDVGAFFSARVTLHDSCHALRDLRVQEQPRALLRRVEGLNFIELPGADICCGFGGTFSVKFPEMSKAMAGDKVKAVIGTGAEVVTGVDSSCLMQIDGMLQRGGAVLRTMHIADILASTRKIS